MDRRRRNWTLSLLAALAIASAACGPKNTETAKPEATPPPDELALLEEDPVTDEELGSPFGEESVDTEPFVSMPDDDIDTEVADVDLLETAELDGAADPFAEDAVVDDDVFADAGAAVEDDLPFGDEIGTPDPPAASGGPCEMATVYFDFDSAALTGATRAALDDVARCMKNDRAMKLRIEGHCDERGTRAYNRDLGSRRANAVRRYLVANGVGANRVLTRSFGEDRPAANGTGESAWSQNRRAEFIDRGRGVVILWGNGNGAAVGTRLDLGAPVWGSDRDAHVTIGDPVWE